MGIGLATAFALVLGGCSSGNGRTSTTSGSGSAGGTVGSSGGTAGGTGGTTSGTGGTTASTGGTTSGTGGTTSGTGGTTASTGGTTSGTGGTTRGTGGTTSGTTSGTGGTAAGTGGTTSGTGGTTASTGGTTGGTGGTSSGTGGRTNGTGGTNSGTGGRTSGTGGTTAGSGGTASGSGGAAGGSGGAAGSSGGAAGGAGSSSFRFLVWADTKTGTADFTTESNQAKALNPPPNFTIYSGDLVESGFAAGPMATWKTAINGGTNNGMFDISFVVRGNHDSTDPAGFAAFFNYDTVAATVGATNLTQQQKNLTYSYDYGNSHFVAVDVPDDATLITATQIAWADSDLAAAEARGLTHAFLNWHGPIYPVAEHCCPSVPAVIDMLNKHPIVTATLHGHEHTNAHVRINKARYPNCTHEFDEFIEGAAGAGPQTCQAGRADDCFGEKNGFAVMDVSGKTLTATIYYVGSTTPLKTFTITKP